MWSNVNRDSDGFTTYNLCAGMPHPLNLFPSIWFSCNNNELFVLVCLVWWHFNNISVISCHSWRYEIFVKNKFKWTVWGFPSKYNSIVTKTFFFKYFYATFRFDGRLYKLLKLAQYIYIYLSGIIQDMNIASIVCIVQLRKNPADRYIRSWLGTGTKDVLGLNQLQVIWFPILYIYY